MKYSFLFLIFLFTVIGCTTEQAPKVQNSAVKSAHGKVNEIIVIADSSLWAGAVGDSFFYYFSAPFLLLPQPESIFDIYHLTPAQLSVQTVKKEFKTLLFLADLNDTDSPTTQLVVGDIGNEKAVEATAGKGASTIVGKDKWARNQILFYVFAKGEENLKNYMGKSFTSIAKKINEIDGEIIKATTYQSGENSDEIAAIKARFGINLKVPGDFKKARLDESSNTLWLRRDSREINANLVIHARPYSNESQLTQGGIKSIRNQIGKIISSAQPNSFMRINDTDLPMFTEILSINNVYTLQAKGIWELENDFLGGPFISNLMLSPDKKTLVLVDGFIYAPGKEKRNFMQEMELILSSASF
jgi:hypothetical protein